MSDAEEQQPSTPYTTLDEAGHWQGTRFIFNEPIKIKSAGGKEAIVAQIETAGMVLEEGMEPDDVIHALINSMHAEEL